MPWPRVDLGADTVASLSTGTGAPTARNWILNTTTHPQINLDDVTWKAPTRSIEVEPWLFAVAVVAIVIAVGSWQQRTHSEPSNTHAPTTLAQAPTNR